MILLKSRLTLLWLLLVAATCISWEAVHGLGTIGGMRAGAAIVIVVAFLKVRFILMDFMELRHAPRFARLAAEAWVVIVGVAVLALL